jgi:signal transduction histidine kinase
LQEITIQPRNYYQRGVTFISEQRLKSIIPVVALIANLGAFFQFQLQKSTSPLPPQWELHFYVLLFFSLLLSCLPLLWDKKTIIWTVLGFKSLILLLISVPMGGHLGIELTLLTMLLIEIFAYLKIWEGITLSVILIALAIFSQHRFLLWGIKLPVASMYELVSVLLYSFFIIILSVLLGFQNNLPYKELNRRLHEATFRLAETNIQLQEYAVLAEQQSAINERIRVGREIHDSLGYILTNLVMMLEAALAMYMEDSTELPEHLSKTRDLAKEGLGEIRRTLHILRAEQQQHKGLVAVKNLVKAFTNATHLEVDLNLGDVPLHFGEEADWTAYRLIQEGMTNAIRHGKATQILISFFRKDNGVGILIKDNGVGSAFIDEGYGLIGMRERIESLGGSLTVSSKPGEGFKLIAWIPLDS